MTMKPPWAFTVWSDADYLYAELPTINGHTAHTVKVPNDVVGLNKLIILAKSRNESSKLGTKGEPTQAQIEKISYDPSKVRKPKPKLTFTHAQINNAREVLRKLGMI
jgi:hypothetical protein